MKNERIIEILLMAKEHLFDPNEETFGLCRCFEALIYERKINQEEFDFFIDEIDLLSKNKKFFFGRIGRVYLNGRNPIHYWVWSPSNPNPRTHWFNKQLKKYGYEQEN